MSSNAQSFLSEPCNWLQTTRVICKDVPYHKTGSFVAIEIAIFLVYNRGFGLVLTFGTWDFNSPDEIPSNFRCCVLQRIPHHRRSKSWGTHLEPENEKKNKYFAWKLIQSVYSNESLKRSSYNNSYIFSKNDRNLSNFMHFSISKKQLMSACWTSCPFEMLATFLCSTQTPHKEIWTDIAIIFNDFPRKMRSTCVAFDFQCWDNKKIQWQNWRWFIKLLENRQLHTFYDRYVHIFCCCHCKNEWRFNKLVLICLSPQGLNGQCMETIVTRGLDQKRTNWIVTVNWGLLFGIWFNWHLHRSQH